MRIGTKLLLTYLILVGVVAIAAAAGLPRLVELTVIRAEQDRLNRQVTGVADRLSRVFRSRSPDLGFRQTLATVEELLVDEAVALIDRTGVVVLSSRPELNGLSLPPDTSERRDGSRPWQISDPLSEVPNLGSVIIARAAMAPQSPLAGYSVALIRDRSFIQDLAQPITQRLYVLLAVVMLAAPLVTGQLSRDLVRRLRTTGEAARALADGDLTRRAPEDGHDEITELAGHFNHMAERLETLVAGLRRSETARRDLLVTVSHELRTPITSITGFAEALKDGLVTGEDRQQRYYQIIAAEATRLSRLIDDLFDVARLEAGQLDLRLQAMDADQWLIQSAESLRPSVEASGRKLELNISPPAKHTHVYGDRDRLDQVMGNLVSNAVRFSPEGGVVRISADTEGEELLVVVSDQGSGIAPDEAEHIFERFYQGRNRGPGHSGAGLGLAIVKSLVEAHGGSVQVRSTPRKGAAFSFRLKRLT